MGRASKPYVWSWQGGARQAVQSAGRTGAAKVHPSLGEAGVKICPAEIVARPTPPKMILIMINLRIPFNAMFFRVFAWHEMQRITPIWVSSLPREDAPESYYPPFPFGTLQTSPHLKLVPDFSATVGYKGSIRFSCVMHPLEMMDGKKNLRDQSTWLGCEHSRAS